jgi:hypothetical protein
LIATAGDQLFDQGTLVISEHDIACGHSDPLIEINGRLCQVGSVIEGVQPLQGLRIAGLSRHPCDASTLDLTPPAPDSAAQQGFDMLSPNGFRLPAQLSDGQVPGSVPNPCTTRRYVGEVSAEG